MRRIFLLFLVSLFSLLVSSLKVQLVQRGEQVEKCERLFDRQDACEFAHLHCSNYDGWFSYLSLYYCSSAQPLVFIFYSLLLTSLFVFIGAAAGEFFCPNLNTIAQFLGLSENITGVTFLALGNGAPDLFASFSAIQQGSYGLAIGELLGAGSFITTVVVGSVAIISGFRVTRRPFLRDVLFFLTAIIILLVVLYDEIISTAESLILIFFYVLYVAVVGIGRMVYQRQKKKRLERYRFQQSMAENNGENALIEEVDQVFVRVNSENHRDSIDTINDDKPLEILSPKSPNDNIFLSSNISNHYDPWFFKHKTLNSLHFGYLNRSRSRHEEQISPRLRTTRFKSSPVIIPDNQSGSSRESTEYLLNDIDQDSQISKKAISDSNLHSMSVEPSAVTIPLSSRASVDNSETPPLSAQGDIHISEFITLRRLKHELFISIPPFAQFLETFLPFTQTWRYLSLAEQIISIVSIPAAILLGITVPVVDSAEEEEALPANQDDDGLDNLSPRVVWKRWIFLLHSFLVPLFIALASGHWFVPIFSVAQWLTWGIASIFISVLSLVGAIRFTSPYSLPRYYKVLCILGFFTAILWIYNIAQEILTLLQSFGIILHISEAILGLTVLAIGNSLADLVADVTVAKMGFPNMAIAACFGGPLLNILLGVGISTLYYNLTHTEFYSLKFTRTLFLSAIGLLISLVSSLILIPSNGWKGTRKYGFYLISIYAALMVINVILEIVHK